ncbi:MAG: thiamine-phosphate kinase [Firmicutes bacterium]|nr:thiamine-phosphate kinase [Bacillota bacterium]
MSRRDLDGDELGRLGEFGLIRRLAGLVPREGRGVLLGIGDDAAALRPAEGRDLLATVDMLVEGVHFSLDLATPFQVGWKALAVSLSDIAAMGGTPRHALLSLGVPSGMGVAALEEIYRGLGALAEIHEVAVIGGNVARSPRGLFLDSIVLGEIPRGELLRRDGARPGDAVLLSGPTGRSAAGLALLLAGRGREGTGAGPGRERLFRAHLQPEPPVALGEILRESAGDTAGAGAGALCDLSDGLAAGLWTLSDASGHRIILEEDRVPLDKDVLAVAAGLAKDPFEWVLFGGEDYELLVTARPGRMTAMVEAAGSRGFELLPVGRVEAGEPAVLLERAGGLREPLARRGYDHFGMQAGNNHL